MPAAARRPAHPRAHPARRRPVRDADARRSRRGDHQDRGSDHRRRRGAQRAARADRRRQPLLPVVQPQHALADASTCARRAAAASSAASPRVGDAVYANPRGDLPAKLGLDYASLKDVNPRIVCCTLTGFGRSGPRAADPAYDYLLQALAGFMSVTGEPDGPPVRCGVAVVDFAGGAHVGARPDGRRCCARATPASAATSTSACTTPRVSMLTYFATRVPAQRRRAAALPRRLALRRWCRRRTSPPRDGWVLVMCMKEKFWQRLTELLGRPDLARDPRYAGFADRLQQPRRAARRAGADLPHRARPPSGSRCCAARSRARRSTPSPRRSPTSRCGTATWSSRSSTRATARCARSAARSRSTTSSPATRPAPPLGADTDAILRDWLGMDASEIAALRSEGAI